VPVPSDRITAVLQDLDAFIEREIAPLQDQHPQYWDHRREHARTDWDADGIPRREWTELLADMRRRADAAGWLRFALPAELGGRDGTNYEMATIRDHLAATGLGLHNDLQNEASVVGNLVFPLLLNRFGTAEQRESLLEGSITGAVELAFGLTEPEHGSDATWMSTRAQRDGDDWLITGAKRWISNLHVADQVLVFARTSGRDGAAEGLTAFLVPTDAPGFSRPDYLWTFNMPTDHAEFTLDRVRVPASSVLGEVDRGLDVTRAFVNENRIRQAASGTGAARYCISESVRYARERVTFGQPLAQRQAIQFPLAELHADCELIRHYLLDTADRLDAGEYVADRVSVCNFRANRLVCEAADRAMQVHGGMGYSRHLPFEHIYRHHRRYRITEGAEEIQIRTVAGHLFGFVRPPDSEARIDGAARTGPR
jgi:alkylation response protein AidB-like acyl-CoA dehydrogenase